MVERFSPIIKEIDYGYIHIDAPKKSIIPNFDERGRIRLSVSKMQLFEKCPLAFKYSYLEKLDLKENEDRERLDMGVDIHDALYCASFQNAEVLRSNELYGKYSVHFENFISFQRLMKKKTGSSIPLYAEKEIFDKDDFVLLYIDRINDLGDGTVEILDYKTGNIGSLSKHQFQLALYTYYVEKHLMLKVSKWSIFYTKENKYKSMYVNRSKVKIIPEIIRLVRQRMNSCFVEGFEKRPNQLCSWCSYTQFGLCSSGQKKTFATFGLLEIFSKPWSDSDDMSDINIPRRTICGGIRVISS